MLLIFFFFFFLVGTEITITEITQSRNNIFVIVQSIINSRGDDTNFGELGSHVSDTFGASNNIQKDDFFLLDVVALDEGVDGLAGGATGGEHRVEKKDPALGDVLGELGVVEALIRALVGALLVTLDEDLADLDATAGIAQSLFHGFSSAHDGDTADLGGGAGTLVAVASGSGDVAASGGEEGKALLNDDADQTISVEDEVGHGCLLVANVGVHELDLRSLTDDAQVGELRHERGGDLLRIGAGRRVTGRHFI